jgi:catechol 2,3-dioxygenase-like lactoylglutathione lyase family enzyme
MVGFYRDLLGFPEILRHQTEPNDNFDAVVGLKVDRARVCLLKVGNAFIEIWEYIEPRGRPPIADRPVCDAGLTHICFDVVDLQSEYDRLVAAGVTFHCPPTELGMVSTTYARDPDGNIVEMQEIDDRDGSTVISFSRELLDAARAARSQATAN